MKNSIVRLSVLALVAAGFTASSISASAAKKTTKKTPVLGMVMTPTPMCPFNDPNGCGIH